MTFALLGIYTSGAVFQLAVSAVAVEKKQKRTRTFKVKMCSIFFWKKNNRHQRAKIVASNATAHAL